MESMMTYKYAYTLLERPAAIADMRGSGLAPNIRGTVSLYAADNGTLLAAEISGLPATVPPAAGTQPVNPFGFHLHTGASCDRPEAGEPFPGSMGHYNPENRPHPDHAGDFPVLLGNNGYAFMVFYTNRFKPADVIGKTIIIHLNPDDFRSQPAGNSGKKIACGVIRKA